jgi:hypothetical protein
VIITAALWQWGAKDMYYILNANAGLVPVAADFVQRERRFLLVSFIVEISFYTILILFKLSLLFFFKRLSGDVGRFKYFWWPTLIFSMITYVVAIGDVGYQCLFGSLEKIAVRCNSRSGTYFLKVTLDVNCALDVLSDFLSKLFWAKVRRKYMLIGAQPVMLHPIFLLWNVQIRWGKKLAIFGIFSLSIITMAIAIVRAADIDATQKSNGLPDSSYLWFWSDLQSFLCTLFSSYDLAADISDILIADPLEKKPGIVVSCAAAFRQLFVSSTRSDKKPVWKPTDSYYERVVSSFRSKRRKPSDTSNLYSIPGTSQAEEDKFDYIAMHDAFEPASQHDSQGPMFVTRLDKPAAACYSAPDQYQIHANQIMREVEYHVTQHPIRKLSSGGQSEEV